MPVPLTALLAATLQQIRGAESDPAALARAADLLSRAAGPGPSSWEVEPSRLVVNGVPIPNDAPGVVQVRSALTRHQIRELRVPARTDAAHWSDLAATLDSASGLYPSAEQFTHALQAAVPGIEVQVSDEVMPEVAENEALRAVERRLAPRSPFTEAEPSLVSEQADRAALSVRLDPLIEAGMAAAARWDWEGLATTILDLHALEASANDAERWIIGQERHRVVTDEVLRHMVRELPDHGPVSVVARAYACLGTAGVDAILEALAEQPSRQAHHSYLVALEDIERGEPALLEALAPSTPAVVLQDVVEVVGRRRIERAIPTLAILRLHGDERVRTSALRALERIGTAEAIAALRRR